MSHREMLGASTLPDEQPRTAPGKGHLPSLADWPQALHVEQVASLLGISGQQVRHLLRTRQLPGRRIGRRWYVPCKSLDAFLSGGDGQ
jgi:excisionase family DNA binding protein